MISSFNWFIPFIDYLFACWPFVFWCKNCWLQVSRFTWLNTESRNEAKLTISSATLNCFFDSLFTFTLLSHQNSSGQPKIISFSWNWINIFFLSFLFSLIFIPFLSSFFTLFFLISFHHFLHLSAVHFSTNFFHVFIIIITTIIMLSYPGKQLINLYQLIVHYISCFFINLVIFPVQPCLAFQIFSTIFILHFMMTFFHSLFPIQFIHSTCSTLQRVFQSLPFLTFPVAMRISIFTNVAQQSHSFLSSLLIY